MIILSPIFFALFLLTGNQKFKGVHGEAFFVNKLSNYLIARKHQTRHLITGVFKIADVKCKQCMATIGWKYLEAGSISQKYKENRFVIEATLIGCLQTGATVVDYVVARKTLDEGKTVDSSTMKAYLCQLNDKIHWLDRQNEEEEEDNDDNDDGCYEKFLSSNDPTTIVTNTKIIYRDDRHYFEMTKDLLQNTEFGDEFEYKFSCDNWNEVIDRNHRGLIFKENRGFLWNNGNYHSIQEEDEDEAEEEEEDDDDDNEVMSYPLDEQEKEEEQERNEHQRDDDEEEDENDGNSFATSYLPYHPINIAVQERAATHLYSPISSLSTATAPGTASGDIQYHYTAIPEGHLQMPRLSGGELTRAYPLRNYFMGNLPSSGQRRVPGGDTPLLDHLSGDLARIVHRTNENHLVRFADTSPEDGVNDGEGNSGSGNVYAGEL